MTIRSWIESRTDVLAGIILLAVLLACRGPNDHHRSQAYLVNRTGDSLVVEASAVDAQIDCEVFDGDTAALLRDEDFAIQQVFEVEPDGVLPLNGESVQLGRSECGPVRLAFSDKILTLRWDASLRERALTNQVDEQIDDKRGLIIVSGPPEAPDYQLGPKLTEVTPDQDFAVADPPACAPQMPFISALEARGQIVAHRWFSEDCVSMTIATTDASATGGAGGAAGLGIGGAGGGGEGGFSGNAGGSAVGGGGLPSAGAGGAGGAGGSLQPPALPKPNLEHPQRRLVHVCVPQEAYPFAVGDEVTVDHNGLSSPEASLALFWSWQEEDASQRWLEDRWDGLPSASCGLVRDACGAIWQTRAVEFSVQRTYRLEPGEQVQLAANDSLHLRWAARVLVAPWNCPPPFNQLGDHAAWLRLWKAQ